MDLIKPVTSLLCYLWGPLLPLGGIDRDRCVCLMRASYFPADNIWTDQNLLLDPDLPSGWRTIKDSTGTYYWHVPTGATQWQHPRLTGTPKTLETQVRHDWFTYCSFFGCTSVAQPALLLWSFSRKRKETRVPPKTRREPLRNGNSG